MSIADDKDFDRSAELMEREVLKSSIARVLDSAPQTSRAGSAETLAELLVRIASALTGDAQERERAARTLREAIELAFLRSNTYSHALELFRLEALGHTIGSSSTLLSEEIGRIDRKREDRARAPIPRPERELDPIEIETERFCELVDEYGSIPEIRAQLLQILEREADFDRMHQESGEGSERTPYDRAWQRVRGLFYKHHGSPRLLDPLVRLLEAHDRFKTDDTELERQIIANSLAYVFESEYTPDSFKETLTDAIDEIHNNAKVFDLCDPDNLREFLPLAIAKMNEKEQEKEER